ncbi:hypothetical protein [Xanthomonas citri]|uniref:hypothetical protein n=1 Tax=Xanthomonas citri TaxID=346 RepID=UPI00131E2774|nr:hypothetical protein [Xanthomonas citri]
MSSISVITLWMMKDGKRLTEVEKHRHPHYQKCIYGNVGALHSIERSSVKYLDKEAAVRRKYASRRHFVLKDSELRSAWTRLRVEATSLEVLGTVVGFTSLGALIGAVVGSVIALTWGQALGVQIPTALGPTLVAGLGFLVGLYASNRPLSTLDEYELDKVSKAVGEEPELFAWVIEALKRGDTLRYRDYTFLMSAYRAVRKSKIEAEDFEKDEVQRNAAIARILAIGDAADTPKASGGYNTEQEP